MNKDKVKLRCLKYEIVDNFLTDEDFEKVLLENEVLHKNACNNVFSELSAGKTTIRSFDPSSNLKSPEIILNALTTDAIKNKVKSFLCIDTNVFSLINFQDKSGHSFFHRMYPGSFLGLHVDRSYLPGTQMVKVANALLYTSKDWDASNGGNLYLRHGLLGKETVTINYKPNRLVLILHTSKTFHGVSELAESAPVRYSAYMDFYIHASDLKTCLADQFWRHETVYLPEFNRLATFLRGVGYSLELLRYLARRRFV